MHQWALARTNSIISSHSLPYVPLLTSFNKKPYVSTHNYLSVLAAFRLSNAGLGNKIPLDGFPIQKYCPVCASGYQLDEGHVLFNCSALRKTRCETGINLFLTQAATKGLTEERAQYLFVTGCDLAGNLVNMETYKHRALAISAVRSAWLHAHVSAVI